MRQSNELWSPEFRLATVDPDADWNWNVGVSGSVGRTQASLQHGEGFFDFTSSDSSRPMSVTVPGWGTAHGTAYTDTWSYTYGSGTRSTVHAIDEETIAAYGGLDYKGWEPVTLHAGVRVDKIRREMVRDNSLEGRGTVNSWSSTWADLPFPFYYYDFQSTSGTTRYRERQPRMRVADDWVHVTPTAGIDWQINPNALLYTKSTYAFKPGGFSAYADTADLVPFAEERVWASEAGLKTTWLDGGLNLNATAFYNSVDNYQLEGPLSWIDYVVYSAKGAEIYGLEFESRYAVLPSLDLLGSIGWTHARLTEMIDPYSGLRQDNMIPPYVPQFDAVAALDYHLPLGLFARVEYLVTGETKFDVFARRDEFGEEMYRQPAYGLLNGAVGWRSDSFTIQLYGTNLTQEEYYTNMVSRYGVAAVGAPLEYGFRAGVRF
jgi:outer membrane receptor protein involved in Fe transport